jgi:hypothetical protein
VTGHGLPTVGVEEGGEAKVSVVELAMVDDDLVQLFEHVGVAGQPTFHNLSDDGSEPRRPPGDHVLLG